MAAIDKTKALRIAGAQAADPDDLLRGVYHLPPHPPVQLPEPLTWTEDPYCDRNWLFQYHSLRFVYSLLTAWDETGDERYFGRAHDLLRAWCANNPFESPASEMSWNQHAASFRAMVLALASTYLEQSEWLLEALELHGDLLADHYEARGNHALNQYQGLLAVGVALERHDWVRDAASAIESLLRESVDAEGVTNEQSVAYQYYNYRRYSEAMERLVASGLEVPEVFSRLELMPLFLAHATSPDGSFAVLGDTQGEARAVPGTPAEFAATKGRQGPRPEGLWAQYRAGFAFGRTGWGGELRPFEDETYYSLSYGPARDIHGHCDGGSISLHARGSALILDPGKYNYQDEDPFRRFFVSAQAHNVVVRDGQSQTDDTPTELVQSAHTGAWDYCHLRKRMPVRVRGHNRIVRHLSRRFSAETDWHRRVLFVREPGFVVIEDVLRSRRSQNFEQLWHLPPGSEPAISPSGAVTRLEDANIQIVQLAAQATPRLVEGEADPVQGWHSPRYGERLAAPVVSWSQTGRYVRYATLLLPFEVATPLESVAPVRESADGIDLDFSAYGREYRVRFAKAEPEVTIDGAIEGR